MLAGADAGKRRPHPDDAPDEGHIRARKPEQCVAGNRVASRCKAAALVIRHCSASSLSSSFQERQPGVGSLPCERSYKTMSCNPPCRTQLPRETDMDPYGRSNLLITPIQTSQLSFLLAGIIYVSDSELGWQPVVESWLQKRKDSEAAALRPCCEKLLGAVLDFVRRGAPCFQAELWTRQTKSPFGIKPSCGVALCYRANSHSLRKLAVVLDLCQAMRYLLTSVLAPHVHGCPSRAG